MMRCVRRLAQPANLKWLRVVIMMGLWLTIAATFARLAHKLSDT